MRPHLTPFARRAAAALAILTLAAARAANAQTLYDGSLGTLPAAQGWKTLIVGGTETIGGGATTLDTTALGNSGRGGYARTDLLLNATAGYTLQFDIQLLGEAHANNDRAGFSIIALSSDKKGIELGFWQDEVWAQSDSPVLFQHAEGAAFDTTAALTRYDLRILGSAYSLSVNGGPTPLLSGSLRDYSAFGTPYDTPNFLFLGDDTGSAQGSVRLAHVALAAAAPEPTTLPLILAGLIAAAVFGRGAIRRNGGTVTTDDSRGGLMENAR
jgi:hypothetical protein